MKQTLLVGLAALFSLGFSPAQLPASNLPVSRQATLVESVSPVEVRVNATGIGHWNKGDSKPGDLDKTLLDRAQEDARKAAIWFVLYGGTDPLLRAEAEKSAFTAVQEDYFAGDNIRKFISWEDPGLLSRVKRDIQKKKEYELTIEKAYKVNVGLLREDLTKRNVLTARESLADLVGLPFIMVIPAVAPGSNPVKTLQTDANLSHAAKVVESYLTARKYDVVVPEQQVDLAALTSAQQMVQGLAEDFSYQLALSIGSDVYITYEVNLQSDKFNTRKAAVNCRAYETTTARLLGTETGYSPASASADMVLIEQAINDAIDKVLSRITAYWQEDVVRGVQYKLIVTISPGFDADQIENITFAMGDVLREVAKGGKFKENIATNQTLDYILWCDPQIYGQSSQLYRKLKDSFSGSFREGVLNRVNLNRKLVLLKVDSI